MRGGQTDMQLDNTTNYTHIDIGVRYVSLSVSLSQFSNMCPVGAELSLTASLPQADIQDMENHQRNDLASRTHTNMTLSHRKTHTYL